MHQSSYNNVLLSNKEYLNVVVEQISQDIKCKILVPHTLNALEQSKVLTKQNKVHQPIMRDS